jgi:hypothetical protein
MRILGIPFPRLLLGFGLTLFFFGSLRGDEEGNGPNFLNGDFESGIPSANPWGGFDEKGLMHVWSGIQMAVDDGGNIIKLPCSPSVALGDLNGDGLPDLIVADARGFFWFFPNKGTPTAPAFTHPEIMPVWLSDDFRTGDVVPRIDLVDYDGDGKLDLVAGNYAGVLYYIHNNGSATAPDFRMPEDHATLQVATHTLGLLWCNYLAPFLYDWNGTGHKDLIMGEGTYSANSIYLLTNTGNTFPPTFDELHRTKIVPGMGKEHLTPQVVDWNGDGKPDIITGEREGFIDVYLNQTPPDTFPPVFADSQHVSFGKTEKIGSLTTVCAGDLNGDKLFDLIVSSTNGHVYYALNQGTHTEPKFGDLAPFTGVNPYPAISLPRSWKIDNYHPYGAAYELLECTDAQREPGLVLPPDFKGHGAMKFSVMDPHATYFKERYVPADNSRHIGYTGGRLGVKTEASYVISFWVRSTGDVSNFTWHVGGQQKDEKNNYINNFYQGQVQTGTTWSRFHEQFHVTSKIDKQNVFMGVGVGLVWDGDGAVYFDDFTLKKAD